MSLELVRKFVNGKWGYVAEEEASGGGSGLVLVEYTTLTNAQILDMFDTPVEVLPSPGESLFNLIHAVAAYSHIVGAYGDGGPLWFLNDPNQYDIVSPLRIARESLMGDNRWSPGWSVDGVVYTDAAFTEDTPTYVANYTEPFTGGHAENTLKIGVWYSTFSIA